MPSPPAVPPAFKYEHHRVVFCHSHELRGSRPSGVALVGITADGRHAIVHGIEDRFSRLPSERAAYRSALLLTIAQLDAAPPAVAGVPSAPVWPGGVNRMLVAVSLAKTPKAKDRIVDATVDMMLRLPVRDVPSALGLVFNARGAERVRGCADTYRLDRPERAGTFLRAEGYPTPAEVLISAASARGLDLLVKAKERKAPAKRRRVDVETVPVMLNRLFGTAPGWCGAQVGGLLFWEVVWPEALRAFVGGVGCTAAREHLRRNRVALPTQQPALRAGTALSGIELNVCQSVLRYLFPTITPDDRRRLQETIQKVSWLAKSKAPSEPLTQVRCFAGNGNDTDPRREGGYRIGSIMSCPKTKTDAMCSCIELAGTTRATPLDVFAAGLDAALAESGTTLADVVAGLHAMSAATTTALAQAVPPCFTEKRLAGNEARMAAAVVTLGVTRHLLRA